jgi:hypothetical protein
MSGAGSSPRASSVSRIPRSYTKAPIGPPTNGPTYLGQHRGVTLVEPVDDAVDCGGVERGAAQEPPEPDLTGDVRVLGAVPVVDDHVSVGVGEGALALGVGVLAKLPVW